MFHQTEVGETPALVVSQVQRCALLRCQFTRPPLPSRRPNISSPAIFVSWRIAAFYAKIANVARYAHKIAMIFAVDVRLNPLYTLVKTAFAKRFTHPADASGSGSYEILTALDFPGRYPPGWGKTR